MQPFPEMQPSPTGPNPVTLSVQDTCPSTTSPAAGMQNASSVHPFARIEQGLALCESILETPETP